MVTGVTQDVLTGLEFERLCSSTGPTEGRLRRPSDGKEPGTIVFVQCVGSRDDDKGHPYCSKTCCLYTAKHATLAKSRLPESQSYVFYIDIRAAGKGYEEFVRRAGEEYGARYLRGRVSKVLERNGKLIVRAEDTLVGRPVEIEADLVVLAVAMEPQQDAAELARRLGISYDEYAFYTEAHPKLRPNETNTAGIFLAGACQAPRDIPDAVAGGSAAAAKALALLAQPELVRSPFVSAIDRLRCTGCFTCAGVCPFDAVERETQRDGTEKSRGEQRPSVRAAGFARRPAAAAPPTSRASAPSNSWRRSRTCERGDIRTEDPGFPLQLVHLRRGRSGRHQQMAYPANVRIVRVPCSGRIDPLFIWKALQDGADGVMVSGCHPGDCHYGQGNYHAKRKLALTRQLLEFIGVEPERLHFDWISAAEGRKFAETCGIFTERVRALGPGTSALSGSR